MPPNQKVPMAWGRPNILSREAVEKENTISRPQRENMAFYPFSTVPPWGKKQVGPSFLVFKEPRNRSWKLRTG